MYRRVNSGRFMVFTTAGIVIIMAIFTWVMYGMAKQVYTMTDVMVTLGKDFSHMADLQDQMASDIHGMGQSINRMDTNIAQMNTGVEQMGSSIQAMGQDVRLMGGAVQGMNANIGRMTYDISRATKAFSQPMSYMWGNPFGF